VGRAQPLDFSPVLHRHLFVLLLAAVLSPARFIGFGPAVFCSLVSTACLDFFAVPPYLHFGIRTGAGRRAADGFPRHFRFCRKHGPAETLAESRAERTTREMAAMVILR